MRRTLYRATARKTLLAFDGGKSAQLTDLAQQVGKSKSSICRALKKLVAVGHVQRLRLDHHLVFVRTPAGEHVTCAWRNQKQKPRSKQQVRTPLDVLRN